MAILTHFCNFLRLGGSYWILIFFFCLVRPSHNFWYPYCLYLQNKNSWVTKGPPFENWKYSISWATAKTARNELKFFWGGPRALTNGKIHRDHFIFDMSVNWLALLRWSSMTFCCCFSMSRSFLLVGSWSFDIVGACLQIKSDQTQHLNPNSTNDNISKHWETKYKGLFSYQVHQLEPPSPCYGSDHDPLYPALPVTMGSG